MPNQELELETLYANHADDIERLAEDVQNAYSASKVSFIYGRLKNMGPWKPDDFSMELILEIDMMQAAIAVEYSRVFVNGSRKVSKDKVPVHLRPVHDAIIELRNKRYAHDDDHPSVKNIVDLTIQEKQVFVKTGSALEMSLGAPREWEELIEWLGEYMHEQTKKQLDRLSDKTGLEWVQPTGPPPDWL